MQLRWCYRILLALTLLLLALAPAAAQSSITIDDDGCGLSQSNVRSAAQKLVDKGAQVIVICTKNAGGNAMGYLEGRLDDLGIATGISPTDLPNSALLFFVSSNPQNSAISSSEAWGPRVSTSRLNQIRDEYMNPQLRRGDFTAAFVDAINGTDTAIESPLSLDGEGTTVDTSGLAPVFWAGLALLVVGVLAAVLVPPFLRSRRQKQAAVSALAQARARFEAARLASGAAIADMGRLLNEARLKQKFDTASYSPSEVQSLQRDQGQAEQMFSQAQKDFDDIEERMQLLKQTGEQDYNAAASGYDGVRTAVQAALQRIEEVEARRRELDQVNKDAPGEVDDIKKG